MVASLSPHDQGREASQLCGANLMEGSFTGLLQVSRDLDEFRDHMRGIGSPRDVVFWRIWLRSVPSIFPHP